MSDTLCATYRVFTRERLTRRLVHDYTTQTIEGTFSYRFKATSSAFLSVAAEPGCDIPKPRPWVDELVVQRDGDDSEVAWFGPVERATLDDARNELQIEAKDLSEWWNRRQILQARLQVAGDAAEAWAAVRQDQDRIDPSGLGSAVTSKVGRTVTYDEPALAETGPILSELGDVAWAVKAGRLYGPGGTTDGEVPHPVKLDASVDWVTETGQAGPVIVCEGAELSTKIYVRGRTGLVGEWPPKGTPVPLEGWHIPNVVTRSDLVDVGDLTAAARQIWETYSTTPVFLASSTGSLRKASPLAVNDLLPGRRYTVDTGVDTVPLVPVELHNAVIDFVSRSVGGINELHEDRVAVDFAPVGVDYNTDRLSV